MEMRGKRKKINARGFYTRRLFTRAANFSTHTLFRESESSKRSNIAANRHRTLAQIVCFADYTGVYRKKLCFRVLNFRIRIPSQLKESLFRALEGWIISFEAGFARACADVVDLAIAMKFFIGNGTLEN